MFASKYQTIWTIVQFRLITNAFPVSVTICGIANDTGLRFAWILLRALLSPTSCLLIKNWKYNEKPFKQSTKILIEISFACLQTIPIPLCYSLIIRKQLIAIVIFYHRVLLLSYNNIHFRGLCVLCSGMGHGNGADRRWNCNIQRADASKNWFITKKKFADRWLFQINNLNWKKTFEIKYSNWKYNIPLCDWTFRQQLKC